jgi:hypothetical protein
MRLQAWGFVPRHAAVLPDTIGGCLPWLREACTGCACSVIPRAPRRHIHAKPDAGRARARHWAPRAQNWDGSGGNGAAMRHFEATGSKYPLVVKLGTITPSGRGAS